MVVGFPCQDNSTMRGANRPGLRGKYSSLLYAIARVIRRPRAAAACHPGTAVVVHVLGENVLGTSQDDCHVVATQLCTLLHVLVDAAHCALARRPRYWWATWVLTLRNAESWGNHQGAKTFEDWAQRPTADSVFEDGWAPRKATISTRTRPALKDTPLHETPLRQRGIQHATPQARRRWRQAGQSQLPSTTTRTTSCGKVNSGASPLRTKQTSSWDAREDTRG